MFQVPIIFKVENKVFDANKISLVLPQDHRFNTSQPNCSVYMIGDSDEIDLDCSADQFVEEWRRAISDFLAEQALLFSK